MTDPDEDQTFIFRRGRELNYAPSTLSSLVKVPEPVKTYENGDIMSQIEFTSDMQVDTLSNYKNYAAVFREINFI